MSLVLRVVDVSGADRVRLLESWLSKQIITNSLPIFNVSLFISDCQCIQALCVQGGSTMTATNHDDQLGEIYPTMLNELKCTFGVSFSRFCCCGHHGRGLWPLWFVVVMV